MARNDKPNTNATGRGKIVNEGSRNPLLSIEGKGTFKETEHQLLKRSWSATPAQRLAWLEEALELAYQAGALPLRNSKEL
jgi:hypothetical protein